MSGNLHHRANELLALRQIEALSRDEQRWLVHHLSECAECAKEEARLRESLRAFRAVNVEVPRNLASRTQLRVRMRAEELQEHGPANRLIWAVAVLSWVFGLATAPLVWRGFAWAGEALHLPKAVWVTGVALWWVIPALVATGVVLLARRGHAGVSD